MTDASYSEAHISLLFDRASQGNQEAEQQLASILAPLARQIIRSFSCKISDNEELESAANEGILRAIRSYNPTRGHYKRFAAKCIYNSLTTSVSNSMKKHSREQSDGAYKELTPSPEASIVEKVYLEQLFENLTTQGRRVCRLYYAGYAVADIAAILSLHHTTVSKYLTKSGKRLSQLDCLDE